MWENIFKRSRVLKNQNFPLNVNHGHDTDFSQLVNLRPSKIFPLFRPLISTKRGQLLSFRTHFVLEKSISFKNFEI